MSAQLAADRLALVTALTGTVTLPGAGSADTAASPATPAVVHPWDAWPVANGSQWLNHCTAESDWFAYVAIPAGDALATAQAFDAVHDAICPQLARVGRITNVTPALWPVANAEGVPVVQVSLTI